MPYYRCPACGSTSYGSSGYSTAARCGNCSASLAGAERVFVAPGARDRRIGRMLPATAEAVSDARRAVGALVLPEATRRTVALLVSELVTNAIRHAEPLDGDSVKLTIETSADLVRLEVRDAGGGFAPQAREREPLSVGGQGLALIDALSEDWGIDRDSDGCTVWCEVIVGEHRDAGRGSPGTFRVGVAQ
jgi:anti-sigma regulatory factor (Ser/Thr protein kinase)